jgi:hypothetical protein
MIGPRPALFLCASILFGASLAIAGEPAPVPAAARPPGSFDPDTGPSDVIYPAQAIPIRFNHALHLSTIRGATCRTCHEAAFTSHKSADRLLPRAAKCDSCHGTDHTTTPSSVTAGPDADGKCGFCHVGWKPEDKNLVAPLVIPPPNLVFDHQKHLARNIGCPQCHGNVAQVELATRDQLPRLRGCFNCHLMPDAAARGQAKSECTTCHLEATGDPKAGRMRVAFPSGELLPPRWLHNAAHTPDWIERHKRVAANDSAFCGNCHKDEFCADCHDGRVRPRSIHPSDYLNMHAIEARMQTQRCESCHHEQSFCLGCHQRVGVSMTGPTAARESGRFHPPKSIWSDPPRKPGSHAQEAQRNLNACVSCHVERDCVVCHGGAGIGGGFDPHRAGFASTCATQMRRNPRPCLVCHEPGAAVLAQCR